MIRRNLFMGFSGLLVVFSLSCGSVKRAIEKLDNFDVTIKSQTEVQGATIGESLLQTLPVFKDFAKVQLSETTEFKNRGYSPKDVDSVVLEKLILRVVDPQGQDLNFIDELEFYVKAPGLAEKRIAWLSSFPSGVSSVAFHVLDQDIKHYVLAQSGEITTKVKAKSPKQTTTLEVEAVFDVDIKIFR